MAHKCLGCGKAITWTFAICTDCEKIYGNRTPQWPLWLRYMWADIARERRRNKKAKMFEISLELIEGTDADIDN